MKGGTISRLKLGVFVVALVLVGLGFLRRSVHWWYLVPARVESTVGSIEDTRYEPPARLFSALQSPSTDSHGRRATVAVGCGVSADDRIQALDRRLTAVIDFSRFEMVL